MHKVELGDSTDYGFLLQLLNGSVPQMIYADTLFGTGKKRETSEASYGDSKTHARLFTRKLIGNAYDLLPENGTFWLHCDQRSAHNYFDILTGVFGKSNLLNEVIWCYASGGRPKRKMAAKHDTIFWFAKNHKSNYTYNLIREPYRSLAPGETRAGFHPAGKPISDWWNISIMSTTSKERVGYPTQKPLELMERIIKISTNPGDLVFDPCCGSGTTILAAKRLDRNGIGVDINQTAVDKARERLVD